MNIPNWSDIKDDPRFASLTLDQQQDALNTWERDAAAEFAASTDFDKNKWESFRVGTELARAELLGNDADPKAVVENTAKGISASYLNLPYFNENPRALYDDAEFEKVLPTISNPIERAEARATRSLVREQREAGHLTELNDQLGDLLDRASVDLKGGTLAGGKLGSGKWEDIGLQSFDTTGIDDEGNVRKQDLFRIAKPEKEELDVAGRSIFTGSNYSRDISDLAEKIRREGGEPNTLVNRLKAMRVWGNPEDEGNLVRKLDNGQIVFNPNASQEFFKPELVDREINKLDLPEEEKKRALEGAKVQRQRVAEQVIDNLEFGSAGALENLNPVGLAANVNELIGLKSDFNAFRAANADKYAGGEELVSAYFEKVRNRPALLRTLDSLTSGIYSGVQQFTLGADKILAAGALLGANATGIGQEVSSDIFNTLTEMERRSQGSLAATGGETTAMVTRTGLDLATMFATGGASAAATRTSGTVANRLARRVATRMAANASERTTLGAAFDAAIANNIDDLAIKVGRVVGEGTAAVQSASGVFGDSYSKNLANNFAALENVQFTSDAEREQAMAQAREDAAWSATKDGLAGGLITTAMMRIVPGGFESVLGKTLAEKPGEVTLRSLLKDVSASDLRTAFRSPEFRSAAGRLATGFGAASSKEVVEEAADEALQGLWSAHSYDPDMTVADFVENVGTAAVLGGIFGAAANVGQSALTPGAASFTPPVAETAVPAADAGDVAPPPADTISRMRDDLTAAEAEVSQFSTIPANETAGQKIRRERRLMDARNRAADLRKRVGAYDPATIQMGQATPEEIAEQETTVQSDIEDVIAGVDEIPAGPYVSDAPRTRRSRQLARVLTNRGVDPVVADNFAADWDTSADQNIGLEEARAQIESAFTQAGGRFLGDTQEEQAFRTDPQTWIDQGYSEEDAEQFAQSASMERATMEQSIRTGNQGVRLIRQAEAGIQPTPSEVAPVLADTATEVRELMPETAAVLDQLAEKASVAPAPAPAPAPVEEEVPTDTGAPQPGTKVTYGSISDETGLPEFRDVTYVGTNPDGTIRINDGSNELNVNPSDLTVGDSAFSFSQPERADRTGRVQPAPSVQDSPTVPTQEAPAGTAPTARETPSVQAAPQQGGLGTDAPRLDAEPSGGDVESVPAPETEDELVAQVRATGLVPSSGDLQRSGRVRGNAARRAETRVRLAEEVNRAYPIQSVPPGTFSYLDKSYFTDSKRKVSYPVNLETTEGVFTNDPEVTAVQLMNRYKVTVPENLRATLNPAIRINESGEVVSVAHPKPSVGEVRADDSVATVAARYASNPDVKRNAQAQFNSSLSPERQATREAEVAAANTEVLTNPEASALLSTVQLTRPKLIPRVAADNNLSEVLAEEIVDAAIDEYTLRLSRVSPLELTNISFKKILGSAVQNHFIRQAKIENAFDVDTAPSSLDAQPTESGAVEDETTDDEVITDEVDLAGESDFIVPDTEEQDVVTQIYNRAAASGDVPGLFNPSEASPDEVLETLLETVDSIDEAIFEGNPRFTAEEAGLGEYLQALAQNEPEQYSRTLGIFRRYARRYLDSYPSLQSRSVSDAQSTAPLMSNIKAMNDLGIIAGDSSTVEAALGKIANDKNLPKFYRDTATTLLSNLKGRMPGFKVTSTTANFAGEYDVNTNTITANMSQDNGQGFIGMLLHELVHAAHAQSIANPVTESDRAEVARLRALKEDLISRLPTLGQEIETYKLKMLKELGLKISPDDPLAQRIVEEAKADLMYALGYEFDFSYGTWVDRGVSSENNLDLQELAAHYHTDPMFRFLAPSVKATEMPGILASLVAGAKTAISSARGRAIAAAANWSLNPRELPNSNNLFARPEVSMRSGVQDWGVRNVLEGPTVIFQPGEEVDLISNQLTRKSPETVVHRAVVAVEEGANAAPAEVETPILAREGAKLNSLPDDATIEEIQKVAPLSVRRSAEVALAYGRAAMEAWVARAAKAMARFVDTVWKNAKSIAVAGIGLYIGSSTVPPMADPDLSAVYHLTSPVGTSLQEGTIRDTLAAASPAGEASNLNPSGRTASMTVPEGRITAPSVSPGEVSSLSSLDDPLAAATPAVDEEVNPSEGTTDGVKLTQEAIDRAGKNEGMAAIGLPKEAQETWISSGSNPAVAQLSRLLGEHESSSQGIKEMIQEIGLKGSPDSVAWCAGSISWSLSRSGIPSNRLGARQFLNFGNKTTSPKYGDVVVMWNTNKDTGGKTGWGGHVGFYVGETDGHVMVLSGNTFDEVNVSAFPKGRVLSYQTPKGREVARQKASSILHSRAVTDVPFYKTLDPEQVGGYERSGLLGFGNKSKELQAAIQLKRNTEGAAQTAANAFKRQIDAFLKKHPDQSKTVNAALGNTDVRVTDAQWKASQKTYDDAKARATTQFQSDMNLVRAARAAGNDAAAALAYSTAVDNLRKTLNTAYESMVNTRALYRQANVTAARAAQVKAYGDIAALDPGFAQQLTKFRGRLDALSAQVAQATGLSPELRAAINDNQGIYLHRAYRIFESKTYQDRLMKTYRNLGQPPSPGVQDPLRAKVVEALANIRGLTIEERSQWLRRESRRRMISDYATNNNVSIEAATQALRSAPTPINRADADTAAQDWVDNTEDGRMAVERKFVSYAEARETVNPDAAVNNSVSKEASVKSDIVRRRKDLPQWLRELWGEYDNPYVSATNTLMELTAYTAQEAYLKEVVRQGTDTTGGKVPFLTTALPDTDGNVLVPVAGVNVSGWEKITDDAKSPLAGYYAHPFVKQVLLGINENQASNNAVIRMFHKLTGAAMAAKTVYSVQSHFRNFFGNVFFIAANGNLTAGGLGNIAASAADTKAALFGTSNEDRQAFLEKLQRLGVLKDNQVIEILNQVAGDADKIDFSKLDESGVWSWISERLATFNSGARNLYQASDDFWKTFAFRAERAKIVAWNSGMTEDQIDNEAARRVRLTMPTYSMAPEIIRIIRRTGVIGAFVTFVAESVRITANTVRLSVEDSKAGMSSVRGRQGAMRLASLTFWQGIMGASAGPIAGYLFQGVAQAVLGDKEDDEIEPTPINKLLMSARNPASADEVRALRSFLPEWQKDAQLWVIGKDNEGKFSYVDISYLNPYSYFTDIAVAAYRGADQPDATTWDRISDTSKNVFVRTVQPFVAPQLFSSALTDTVFGDKIWNPDGQLWNEGDARRFVDMMALGRRDAAAGNLVATTNHILQNAFLPGTIRSAQRIAAGATGQTSASGRSYETVYEAASVLGFAKIESIDPAQAVADTMRTQLSALTDASGRLTRTAGSRGTVSDQAIRDAVRVSEDNQFEAFRDLRKTYSDGLALGVTPNEIQAAAQKNRIGDNVMDTVRRGVFNPEPPTKATLKSIQGSVPTGEQQNRIQLILEAYANERPKPLD